MASRSPLDAPHLRQIDDCLSAGDVGRAQELLAHLDGSESPAATTYLATRLLYLRDRLDPSGVAERLSELLLQDPHFPEARRLLDTANAGVPGSASLHPPGFAELRNERTASIPAAPATTGGVDSRRIVVDTRDSSGTASASRPTRTSHPGREGRYSVRGPAQEPRRARPAQSELPQGMPSIPAPAPLPQIAGYTPALPSAPSHSTGTVTSSSTDASSRSGRPPSSVRPLAAFELPHELWPEIELGVLAGDCALALDDFTHHAKDQLSHLPRATPQQEFTLLGILCAELLNKAWVTHHFAPFDLSLYSLPRLEAATATLCGMQPFTEPHSAVSLLLGAYVGEVLRRAHRGDWIGALGASHLARVRAGSTTWQPFQSVRHWLLSGGRTSLLGGLSPGLAGPGTSAWRSYTHVKATPKTLWHGDVDCSGITVLARAMESSVLSRACELLHGRPLDGSIDSLDGFEQLLRTIVSSAHPLTGKEAWLQRVALLAGAYLGETIARHTHARWTVGEATGSDQLPRFVLELETGRHLKPIEHILIRAASQHPLDMELFANISLDRSS